VLIHKKLLQGVMVLGWLVWSLPAIGAGEQSLHEGKQAELGSGKHGGHPGAAKKDMVENIVGMVMVVQKDHLQISQLT
jgi:hypothetical protein